MPSNRPRADTSFLEGGGAAGLELRSRDWSASPLGAPPGWPAALRTALRLLLLHASRPMLVLWGLEHLCFHNDAYAALLAPGEAAGLLGRPAREVWGAQWSSLASQLAQALAGRNSAWQDYRLLPVDDDEAEGGIGGVLLIGPRTTRQADLTHRLAVLSSLREGIFVTDPHGRVISCNAAAERIVGTDWAHWKGGSAIAPGWQPLREDGSPMPAQELPVGKVLAGLGPQLGAEVRAVDPHGQMAVFELSAIPVDDEETGELIAAVTLFVDVTARKRAEEELHTYRAGLEALVLQRTTDLSAANEKLREAVRFNQTLMNAIPGRVVYWTPGYRLVFANQAFADWFDSTPEQLVGADARELHGDAYFEFILPDVQAALRGQRLDLLRETRNARNRLVTHQVHYVPDIAADGTVKGLCVVGFEVTELKAAQAELQRINEALAVSRDEAQKATRAKSAFLANMSHEIRTPMNAIIGLTHLLSRDTTDAVQRERLGKITDAAHHLLRVINDILDLSKVEAGKLDLETVEFDLGQLIARAVELVDLRAREKNLRIEVAAEGVPLQLRGDSMRLSQILINLLTNAVKFTEHGGVRIVAAVAEREPQRVKLRIEVQDSGPGIPLEQQAELFHPFTQADSSISRQHGGTGLGLALSRQLALAMGGEAGVQSQPGAGSTFWFTVWLALGRRQEVPAGAPAGWAPQAGRAAATEAEARLRREQGGRRILLAEDNEVNREIAEELLRSAGLVVEVAVNGMRAVELCLARPFDLVLMDVQMPLMDGLEATQAIRAGLGPALPIVAMTANAFSEDREMCLAAGMNDHVAKPVDPASMYAALLRWLPPRQPPAAAAPAAAEPTPEQGLARLKAVAGLDAAAGLANAGSRPSIYLRVLRRFAETYRGGLGAPSEAGSEEGEWLAGWAAACHSARGALATIGAPGLGEQAAALEQALARSPSRAAHLEAARALQQGLARLVADIDAQRPG